MAVVLMIMTLMLVMLLVGRCHGNDGCGTDDGKDCDADDNLAAFGDADGGGHGDDDSDGMVMVTMMMIW